jgi:hypothetical protein
LFLPVIGEHPRKAPIFFGDFLDDDVGMLRFFTQNADEGIGYFTD